jgi:hypothetical protein
MAIAFSVSDTTTPTSPQQIYDAWLSSYGHKSMTGGHLGAGRRRLHGVEPLHLPTGLTGSESPDAARSERDESAS